MSLLVDEGDIAGASYLANLNWHETETRRSTESSPTNEEGSLISSSVPLHFLLTTAAGEFPSCSRCGGRFYKNSSTDVAIIVCNLDDGCRSQGLIRDLYDTPKVAIKFVQTSPMDFEQTIIREKVSAVVVIPKDYSKNVLSGTASLIVHSGQIATVFTPAPSRRKKISQARAGGKSVHSPCRKIICLCHFHAISRRSFRGTVRDERYNVERHAATVAVSNFREREDLRQPDAKLFWVGGMLTLITFYALFRYKLAQRLKRLTAD